MIYTDRFEAGERLAEKLKDIANENTLIVALPRGGVPLAYVISRKLSIPMDIYFVKKIPSPYNPEAAIGAISEDNHIFVNERARLMLNVAREYIEEIGLKKLEEMRKKRAFYKKDRIDPRGKRVIIVDDGIATGSSMLVAAQALKNEGAKEVIIAAPVAPPEVAAKLKDVADQVVLLQTPYDFMAVGQYYKDFHQLEDEEVKELLESN